VSVEVDASGGGLPGVVMVGLPDATVRESRDRVRAAIRNSGFPFPPGRVTVSLAPADLKKEGPVYDLPIALGFLAATKQIKFDYKNKLFLFRRYSPSRSLRFFQESSLPLLSDCSLLHFDSNIRTRLKDALQSFYEAYCRSR